MNALGQALGQYRKFKKPSFLVQCQYKDRGIKGYNLTEQFFALLRSQFPELLLDGPQRAGADIPLGKVLQEYPNPKRPVDFIIYGNQATLKEDAILAVGLARYDSDRGGGQEDDRIGGYRHCADEILTLRMVPERLTQEWLSS